MGEVMNKDGRTLGESAPQAGFSDGVPHMHLDHFWCGCTVAFLSERARSLRAAGLDRHQNDKDHTPTGAAVQ